MYYVHKYRIKQCYGGPQEGGWWYDSGTPVPTSEWTPLAFECDKAAYQKCTELNLAERARQQKEEDYEYTSVLSSRSTHYSYNVSELAVAEPYPTERPHYE